MTCKTTEPRLPLFVGGDLDAKEQASVEAHLATCPGCRGLEAGLRESRAFLLSAPPAPFSEDELRTIRQSVLVRLEEPRTSLASWLSRPLTLLAAAALLAAALLIPLLFRPPVVPPVAHRGDPPPPVPTAVVVVAQAAPDEAAPEEAAPGEPIPPVKPSRPRRSPVRPSPPRTDIAAAIVVTPENSLHIELQTVNPNVRIIWMVPKPEPPTTTSDNV